MEILLLIAIMLATAKVMGYLFERIGQPVVLGQIFGGLLIGIFFETNPVIAQFSNLGVLLLLFMAGSRASSRSSSASESRASSLLE